MFHFFLLVSSIFLLEHSLHDIKENLYLGYAMKLDMLGNTSSHPSILMRRRWLDQDKGGQAEF